MKDYLIDVPVRINIWIRPECQKKQFDIIKKVRPSILFLISDGGRNENEMQLIISNRKMIDENIDWNCQVYRLYEDQNNGLYSMGKKSSNLIWSIVDRCILLEDDILPTESFFKYCAELLEKYKDDLRISNICGMNHLGICKEVSSDYFFSRQGSIWGVATWKRVIEQRGDFSYGNDPYIMKLLKQRTRHNHISWKRIIHYAKSEIYEGHIPAGEFYYEFNMYGYNQLQIIPKYNLINNIGFGENSAHMDTLDQMPHGIRKVFNMETYELEFPLKHAKYVIPDVEYEKKRNRIMAYNTPVIHIFRIIEKIFIKIKSGKFIDIYKMIIKKFSIEK